jgi:hypothetical protein
LLKLAITDAAPVSTLRTGAPDYPEQIWRDNDGNICAYGNTSNGQHWMHLPNLASFCFGGRESEVKAFAHLPSRPELITDAYYRSVLPMALQALGTEVLHASGFVADRGVIAFCANSGTGKSTLACGMSRRGYALRGDDAIAFERSGAGVCSIPLPFSLRLQPDAVAYFGAHSRPTARGNCQSNCEDERLPLSALVVLRRRETAGDGVVESARLAPNQAFLKVLAHAYCFSLDDPERKRLMITNYIELVTRVPVYEVAFEVGINNVPAILDCVEQLVHRVCAEAK